MVSTWNALRKQCLLSFRSAMKQVNPQTHSVRHAAPLRSLFHVRSSRTDRLRLSQVQLNGPTKPSVHEFRSKYASPKRSSSSAQAKSVESRLQRNPNPHRSKYKKKYTGGRKRQVNHQPESQPAVPTAKADRLPGLRNRLGVILGGQHCFSRVELSKVKRGRFIGKLSIRWKLPPVANEIPCILRLKLPNDSMEVCGTAVPSQRAAIASTLEAAIKAAKDMQGRIIEEAAQHGYMSPLQHTGNCERSLLRDLFRFMEVNSALRQSSSCNYLGMGLWSATYSVQLPNSTLPAVSTLQNLLGTSRIDGRVLYRGSNGKSVGKSAVKAARLVVASCLNQYGIDLGLFKITQAEVDLYRDDYAVQLCEIALASCPEASIRREGQKYVAETTARTRKWLGDETIHTVTAPVSKVNATEARLSDAFLGELLKSKSDFLEPVQKLITAARSVGQRVLPATIPHISTNIKEMLGNLSPEDFFTQRDQLLQRSVSSSLRVHTPQGVFICDEDHHHVNEALLSEVRTRATRLPDTSAVRAKLPIVGLHRDLMDTLQHNQVVVVSGGTGSGKSTQIPQYILDNAIENGVGPSCRVLVTQPRRIAATSVAQRVAAERGEVVGSASSVGYRVRLASKPPRQFASIEYCTTGTALRAIQSDPLLKSISHVIIDEVHERDIYTDFLLLLMKDILKERPDFRLILMSATLDASAFAEYFENAPLVEVPSTTRYAVEEIFLDDILKDQWGTASLKRHAATVLQEESLALESELRDLQYGIAHKNGDALSGADTAQLDKVQNTVAKHNKLMQDVSLPTTTGRRRSNTDDVICSAAVAVIESFIGEHFGTVDGDECDSSTVCNLRMNQVKFDNNTDTGTELIENSSGGSLLVFLPGWQEIKYVQSELEKSDVRKRCTIIPLHSSLSNEEQQAAFLPAPNGTLKVILSTNIAESSVTIDDVLAVVDSGKVREMCYDTAKRMSTMETVNTSSASATQRLGRAGRVAPGKCFRLYSQTMQNERPPRSIPEIQRMELQQTCLQAKSMLPRTTVHSVLRRAMDPPSCDSVSIALDRLKAIGALGVSTADSEADIEHEPWKDECLTKLGKALASLSVEPRVGRMILLGLVMRCVDPALVAAAYLTVNSPFMGMRDTAIASKVSFSAESDIEAAIHAFGQYQTVVESSGTAAAYAWARSHNLRHTTLRTMDGIVKQLRRELVSLGYVSRRELDIPVGQWGPNLRSDISALRSAIYLAGTGTELAYNVKNMTKKALQTTREERVTIHVASINNPMHAAKVRSAWRHRRGGIPEWYTFREVVMNQNQISLRDTSALSQTQMLLFGGDKLEGFDSDLHKGEGPCGVLDKWILAHGKQSDFKTLLELRTGLDNILLRRTLSPRRYARYEPNPVNESQRSDTDSHAETCFSSDELLMDIIVRVVQTDARWTPTMEDPTEASIDIFESDWACAECTYRNFSSRDSCRNCSEPRPYAKDGKDFG